METTIPLTTKVRKALPSSFMISSCRICAAGFYHASSIGDFDFDLSAGLGVQVPRANLAFEQHSEDSTSTHSSRNSSRAWQHGVQDVYRHMAFQAMS